MSKVLIACWYLCLVVGSNRGHSETIRVAAVDWCPQICVDKALPGFVIETIRMIFKDSPYELDIEMYPWTRSINMVKAGEAHALLAPVKSEAPNLLYPEHALGLQKMCFWTRADSKWRYTNIDSLKNKQIGFAYDITIAELSHFMANNQDKFQLMSFNHEYISKNMKKLEFGWIDTFLLSYNFAMHELKSMKVKWQVRLAGCLTAERFYMAFAPQSRHPKKIAHMMKYFDLKMAEDSSRKKIALIMERYGLPDWQAVKE